MGVVIEGERAQRRPEVPATKVGRQLPAQRLAVRYHPAFAPIAGVVGVDAQTLNGKVLAAFEPATLWGRAQFPRGSRGGGSVWVCLNACPSVPCSALSSFEGLMGGLGLAPFQAGALIAQRLDLRLLLMANPQQAHRRRGDLLRWEIGDLRKFARAAGVHALHEKHNR